MSGWHLAIGVLAGLLVVWLATVVALYLVARREDDPVTLRDVVRLVPDVLRLVRRLAADPALPRGVRWRLGALIAYLAIPIDLVPDFIPVAGQLDDAIVVALVLRFFVRAGGEPLIRELWPGGEKSLALLLRLAGAD
jgi:uncharacterized membrane protein YkvA (DUF1232 family)